MTSSLSPCLEWSRGVLYADHFMLTKAWRELIDGRIRIDKLARLMMANPPARFVDLP